MLDPEECPKPDLEVPDDSVAGTSLDGGKKKKKKKKKKKHSHSRKSDDLELKVTNQGVGADTPIWTAAVSPKGSESSSSSTSEGDSSLGSNPSVAPQKAMGNAPPL